MKKIFSLLIAIAFVFTIAAPVFAADLPKPIEKLTKGTVEVAKSPLVIYEHTKGEYDKAEFKPYGLVKGLIESPFHVAKKAGHGAIDMVTFPID